MAALTAVLGAAACAHVEAPPGGPEDNEPPEVISIRPTPDSIVPGYTGPVVVSFNERISETGIEDAVIVSPRTSPVAVDHGRREIRVSLREGWAPDVIYHVSIRPDVRDLFNNVIQEPIEIVFSTGPEIPETIVEGSVIDRLTGQPEAEVRVEAIRAADSLVYATATDREGWFQIGRIPEGEYQIRAFEDLNRNRELDGYERSDSGLVEIRSDVAVEVALRLLAPDSTAPVLASAESRPGAIDLEFDDYLDPEQTIGPEQISVLGPSGMPVPIGRIAIGALPVPPPDSIPDLPDAPAPADSVGVEDALPAQRVVVELGEDVEMEAGAEYTITATGIRNLFGLEGGGEATLTVPDAEPEP